MIYIGQFSRNDIFIFDETLNKCFLLYLTVTFTFTPRPFLE